MQIIVQMGVIGLFMMIGLVNIYLIIRIAKSLKREQNQYETVLSLMENTENDIKIHTPKSKKKA